jgi:hypothetical protein
MTDEVTTDNKVEIKSPDEPRLKHEVEEIIEREQAGAEGEQAEEGITTDETPQPKEEAPEWQSKLSEMEQQLQDFQNKYSNLERRYESSSEEGQRLARQLEQYRNREQYLRSNYDIDPLLEGYQEPAPPEERPITRQELEQWSIENQWRSAEDAFFSHPDNKDVAGNFVLKEMVKRLIFDDDGQYLRYPDRSPREAFGLAAAEVRNLIAGERLRGKEEVRQTRTQLERAAIAEGEGAPPKPTEDTSAEEETPGEDSYVEVWKKQRERTRGDW